MRAFNQLCISRPCCKTNLKHTKTPSMIAPSAHNLGEERYILRFTRLFLKYYNN